MRVGGGVEVRRSVICPCCTLLLVLCVQLFTTTCRTCVSCCIRLACHVHRVLTQTQSPPLRRHLTPAQEQTIKELEVRALEDNLTQRVRWASADVSERRGVIEARVLRSKERRRYRVREIDSRGRINLTLRGVAQNGGMSYPDPTPTPVAPLN